MKNLGLTLTLIFLVIIAKAQVENGTVYIEHEAIDKTKAMWNAFVSGDKETYASFFADSIRIMSNENDDIVLKENISDDIDWWTTQFANLSVEDNSPAFPDAIEYDEGGLWVQDWLLVTGTHIETGINLHVQLHNLYAFNDEGKINFMIHYFDNDIFQEIENSQRTLENGKVYINHPYINVVRKLVNAYCAEDIDAMLEYYADDALFSDMTMEWGESVDLETRKQELADGFASMDNITFTQIGYPDCIYYQKNDGYVVYSWWECSFTQNDTEIILPIMLTHHFNDEGKIGWESAFFSSNHLE